MATAPTTAVQYGQTSQDVTNLQNFLISQGYSIPAGATGYFGDQTKAALSSFQSANGITSSTPGYGTNYGPLSIAAATKITTPTTTTPSYSAPTNSSSTLAVASPMPSLPAMNTSTTTPQTYNPPSYSAPPPTPAPTPTPTTPTSSTPSSTITASQLTSLPNLGPGSTGTAVQTLQDFLVKQGYMTQAQVNTGYGTYGPQTTAAVAAWQKAMGIDTQGNPGYFGPISKSFLSSSSASPLGIPSSVASAGPSMPSPSAPIPASSLTSGTDALSKVLGANVPSGLNISSDIAGLLSLYGASTKSQENYDALTSKLTTLMDSLGNESADLQAAMDAQGVGAAYQNVKELNLKAAQLKGQLEAFDVGTLQGRSAIEDQAIPTGLITGQQAQLQKQRDLTRIGMASELSATIALSQAYQGNAQLGMELAKNAVDLKYAPVLNQINTLKTQLGIAADVMNREDASRSKIIGALLTLKENEINQAKTTATQLASITIDAAKAGAPLSIINQAKATGDPTQAASILASYLKGSVEKVGTSGTGTSGTGSTIFSQTQINKGAANAGVSIDQFSTLDQDTKNYFINSYSTFAKILSNIQAGNEDANAVINEINSSQTLSQSAKDILISKVKPYVTSGTSDTGGGGGILSTIGGWFGSAWEGLKSLF